MANCCTEGCCRHCKISSRSFRLHCILNRGAIKSDAAARDAAQWTNAASSMSPRPRCGSDAFAKALCGNAARDVPRIQLLRPASERCVCCVHCVDPRANRHRAHRARAPTRRHARRCGTPVGRKALRVGMAHAEGEISGQAVRRHIRMLVRLAGRSLAAWLPPGSPARHRRALINAHQPMGSGGALVGRMLDRVRGLAWQG